MSKDDLLKKYARLYLWREKLLKQKQEVENHKIGESQQNPQEQPQPGEFFNLRRRLPAGYHVKPGDLPPS